MQQEYLDVKEVAFRLGFSAATIKRWIKAGKLVAHKMGGRLRIAPAEVKRFEEETRVSK